MSKHFVCLIFLLLCASLSAQHFPLIHIDFDGHVRNCGKLNLQPIVHGDVEFVSDRFGRPCHALHFDGQGNYLELKSVSSLNNIQHFTVVAWLFVEEGSLFQSDDLSWLTIVCKGDSPNEDQSPHFRLQVTNATISINSYYTERADIEIPVNRWFFIACTFDGYNIILYIDGEPIYRDTYNFKTLQVNNEPLNIGRDVPGNLEFYSGSMDDFRLFDNALTLDEVKYEAGRKSGGGQYKSKLVEYDRYAFVDESCKAVIDYVLPPVGSCTRGEWKVLTFDHRKALLKPGEYRDIWQYKYESSNSRVGYHITVKDTILPTVTDFDHLQFVEGQYDRFADSYIVHDNCQVKQAFISSGPIELNQLSPGDYYQTLSIEDIHGNIAHHSRRIEVVQELLPISEDTSSTNSSSLIVAAIPEEKRSDQKEVESEKEPTQIEFNQHVTRKFPERGEGRKFKYDVQRDLSFRSSRITMFIMDSDIEDDDSVNVYLNDVMIYQGIRLKKLKRKSRVSKWKQIKSLSPHMINLSEGENLIAFEAINLGSVGKNTLKVLFFEGTVYDRKTFSESKLLTKPFVINSDIGVAGAIRINFSSNEE